MSELQQAVHGILQRLGALRILGKCPVLVCTPDILVLRSQSAAPNNLAEERVEVPEPDYHLDGHACISALTAAHLCLGPASEYDVWLSAMAGPTGRSLIEAAQVSLRSRGIHLFSPYLSQGEDREITTPLDTAERVARHITSGNNANQLAWDDLVRQNWLPWLRNRAYVLLLGDAESRILKTHVGQVRQLAEESVATVVDTMVWHNNSERVQSLWENVKKIVCTSTFISVSADDAPPLAHALGMPTLEPPEHLGIMLAKSLPCGYVLLHGKHQNSIFKCASGENLVTVPACAIKPVSTNGAGDTFNGAFALGIMAVGASATESSSFSASDLADALGFATAVVSIRLQSGSYPTRNDLLAGVGDLHPRADALREKETAEGQASVSNGLPCSFSSRTDVLAHLLASTWSGVPRIALVDLDHTLCDSAKWRRIASEAAFAALHVDDAELYDCLYEDHESWYQGVGGNIRYTWRLPGLFYLVLALHRMGVTSESYMSLRDRLLNDELTRATLAREVARSTEDRTSRERVDQAMRAFDLVPANPYPDAVAGLFQLRDVLGFQLFVVTEGDESTQRWKLAKLGLLDLFSDVKTEEAFASIRQVDDAFARAIAQCADPEAIKTLKDAHVLCAQFHTSLKAAFRSAALKETIETIVKRSYSPLGVRVCTVGDRLDTDVIPYLAIRQKDLVHQRLQGGQYRGIVISRLLRGPYKDADIAAAQGARPDIAVESLPELAAKLSVADLWRDESTIMGVSNSQLPELTRDKKNLLTKAAKLADTPEMYNIIKKITRYSYGN